MKNLFFMLAIAISSLNVFSQNVVFTPQVLSSGGSFAGATDFTVSQTIGEMTAVTTLSTADVIFTQGFQQPDDRSTLGITDLGKLDGALSLFPNPANDFTHLTYEFPQSGNIILGVYNTLGQRVSSIFSEQYRAGEKTFTFYTAELAAGVYYVNALFTIDKDKQYSFTKKLDVIR